MAYSAPDASSSGALRFGEFNAFGVIILISALIHVIAIIVFTDAVITITRTRLDDASMINLKLGSFAAAKPPETAEQSLQHKASAQVKAKPERSTNRSNYNLQGNVKHAKDYNMKSAVNNIGSRAPQALGAPVAAGNSDGLGQEELRKYEQMLAIWIARYKIYPQHLQSRRISGEPVLRLRISRDGEMMSAVLARSSGSAELDKAALEMVWRASPVPAVPVSYRGSYFDFLLPVSYKLIE
jgi:protein TonB